MTSINARGVVDASGEASTTQRLWSSSHLNTTPPSINELPLDTRNVKYRRARSQWQSDMAWLMQEKGNVLPRGLASVEASAFLTFTTSRRRDEGNYRSHLEKWLGDVLQATDRLTDDTPEYYRFGDCVIETGDREATIIVIKYTLGETA